MILQHFEWLSNMDNFLLNASSFGLLVYIIKNYSNPHYKIKEKGVIYLCNCDFQLRPIVVIDTSKINPNTVKTKT